MINPSTRTLMAVVGFAAFLAGCASSIPGFDTNTGRVGSNPGGLSPQLVYEPPEFKKLVWWNAASFQPVSEDLAAGREFCRCLDGEGLKYVAIGYHPYARNSGGYPIPGGGYLCVGKAGDQVR